MSDTVQALLCTRDWIFGKKGKININLVLFHHNSNKNFFILLEKESISVDDLTDDIFHMTLFDRHDALEEQGSLS